MHITAIEDRLYNPYLLIGKAKKVQALRFLNLYLKNMTATSLRSAALISGISLLVMVIAAPFAEMYVFPKLIVPFNAPETAKNIAAHEMLFILGLFAYLVTFILDIVLSWSLYILMKPVNKALSQLTCFFRLSYSIVALIALNNMVTAFRLITTAEYSKVFDPEQSQALAMVYLRAFKNQWYFGLILFAIHLLLLGYLILRSGYIPKIVGVLVIVSGVGYFLNSIKPYFLPGISIDFAMYTFFGEIIFMIWLLIKGWKLKEPFEITHSS